MLTTRGKFGGKRREKKKNATSFSKGNDREGFCKRGGLVSSLGEKKPNLIIEKKGS